MFLSEIPTISRNFNPNYRHDQTLSRFGKHYLGVTLSARKRLKLYVIGFLAFNFGYF